jgi:hypothetical protein
MLTYSDLIEHAVDYLGGAADNREQSFIRRAVFNAFQRIAYHPRGWRYFIRRARVNLNALYSTGTVAYTSSSRSLTLTGGTWPTWAALGEVRINSLIYEVESRTSNTVLVLKELNAPAADISSTTYEIFQSSYPLPIDFQDVLIIESQNHWFQRYVKPEQWFTMQRSQGATGAPQYWTVLGDNNANTYGRKAIHVYPAPTASEPLEFLMRRAPREMRYSGQETAAITGTIAVSAGAAAVTGTSTLFTARMVGSVLRVTDGSNVPTGLGGLEPYAEEFVISARASTTGITLASNAVAAYSGAKFRVSDAVDAADCMIPAIKRAVEYELAIMNNKSDASVGRAQNLYTEELIRAMEADQVAGMDQVGTPFIISPPGEEIIDTVTLPDS